MTTEEIAKKEQKMTQHERKLLWDTMHYLVCAMSQIVDLLPVEELHNTGVGPALNHLILMVDSAADRPRGKNDQG